MNNEHFNFVKHLWTDCVQAWRCSRWMPDAYYFARGGIIYPLNMAPGPDFSSVALINRRIIIKQFMIQPPLSEFTRSLISFAAISQSGSRLEDSAAGMRRPVRVRRGDRQTVFLHCHWRGPVDWNKPLYHLVKSNHRRHLFTTWEEL